MLVQLPQAHCAAGPGSRLANILPPGFANLLPLFVPGQCGEVHYTVPGGRRSNFQHKSLIYRYSDGAITVG